MGTPSRWSDAFLVNVITDQDQNLPAVTLLSDGRLAFAYGDYSKTTDFGGTDGDDYAIRVQVHNADGSLSAGPVQANTVTDGSQENPVIAALPGGGFVVVFEDHSDGSQTGNDDTDAALRMQIFNASGIRVGSNTLANGITIGAQTVPAVAVGVDGRIMVVYGDDSGTLGDADAGVVATIFDSSGNRIVADFRVNTITTGSQENPRVAALTDGRFLVTYSSSGAHDGSGRAIMARVFDGQGTEVIPEFIANTTTTNDQAYPDATALVGGGFVLTWSDASHAGSDTSYYGVRAQVFNASGQPLGAEIEVNTATTGIQYLSKVLSLSDGRFVVAWQDSSAGVQTGGDDSDGSAIRAQLFKPNGTKSGGEFLVNTVTTSTQADVEMVETADGRLLFTYLDSSLGTQTGGDDPSAAIRATFFELRDGAQTWTGGEGSESYSGTRWNDVLDGAGGDDVVMGAGGNDWISGAGGADELRGDDGNDRLYGGNDDDVLLGGAGKDRLYGQDGADRLLGEAGKDRLDGGASGDVLIGGLSRDVLIGGAGYDQFVYVAEADSAAGRKTRDRIQDFQQGFDILNLAALDANLTTIPDDDFSLVGRSRFSNTPGELRYAFSRNTTILSADTDGDGKADFQIEVRGRIHFDDSDFFL